MCQTVCYGLQTAPCPARQSRFQVNTKATGYTSWRKAEPDQREHLAGTVSFLKPKLLYGEGWERKLEERNTRVKQVRILKSPSQSLFIHSFKKNMDYEASDATQDWRMGNSLTKLHSPFDLLSINPLSTAFFIVLSKHVEDMGFSWILQDRSMSL